MADSPAAAAALWFALTIHGCILARGISDSTNSLDQLVTAAVGTDETRKYTALIGDFSEKLHEVLRVRMRQDRYARLEVIKGEPCDELFTSAKNAGLDEGNFDWPVEVKMAIHPLIVYVEIGGCTDVIWRPR